MNHKRLNERELAHCDTEKELYELLENPNQLKPKKVKNSEDYVSEQTT
jgi:hypothetical protein